jgi:penicillin-binding protein 1A
MTGPLTAGEKLAPSGRGRRGNPHTSGPKGGTQPPGKSPKRKRGVVVRVVHGLAGAMLGIVLLGGIAGAAGGYMAYEHFAADLPDVDGLRNYQPPVMSRVYAGDARLLAELASERRIFVPVGAMPEIVKQAFISAEDKTFYTHRGIDPLAIARAAVFDLAHAGEGRRPIGASTITQQVAKNMLLDNQVSFARKAKEAILAIRIEQTLSKDRILELYLNEIYLGQGAYGVAAAAQTYFNKPLDKLSIAEAAFLAALPKAPNNLNPFKYPEAARSRRDYVLDRLEEDHAISAAQEAEAKAAPVIPSEFRRPPPIPGADWFTEEVRRQLVARFGPDTTTQGGLMVRTSLDPTLQVVAEKSLRDGLMAYDRKYGGWRGAVSHVALPADDFETKWPAALNEQPRPSGMLPSWKLAVVATVGDGDAKVEWLNTAGERRAAMLALADTTWARPVRDNKPGPTPRRMSDVVQVGDVVMIEPPAVMLPPPTGPVMPVRGKAPPPPPSPPAVNRAMLRQIQRSRARWCRSTRRPAGSWRWWAAGVTNRASSTGSRRPAGSLGPASSRWCI